MLKNPGNALYKRKLRYFILLLTVFAVPVAAQEDEQENDLPWNVTAGARYVSRFTNHGVDLSQDQPATPFSLGVSHRSGFSFSGEAVNVLGSAGGLQQSSFALGYERTVVDPVTISGEFAHYFYKSDTVNALAGMSNSLSLDVDVDFESVSLSASYSGYLGGNGASYFGFSASGYYAVGEGFIVPFVQVGFVSQTVESVFLKVNRSKSKGQMSSLTQSVTGLSNVSLLLIVSYPIGGGFAASLVPTLTYTPSELSSRTSQFIWSAGIRYSTDF